jgi:hypothetical protein
MNFTEANHLEENKLTIHVPLEIEILSELFPHLTFDVKILYHFIIILNNIV